MSVIQTDYNELFKFARSLRKFADEIEYQMKKLVHETDSVTAYSWRGRQAEEFSGVVHDSKHEMDKQIIYLRELAEAVDEKATMLKIASERKLNN